VAGNPADHGTGGLHGTWLLLSTLLPDPSEHNVAATNGRHASEGYAGTTIPSCSQLGEAKLQRHKLPGSGRQSRGPLDISRAEAGGSSTSACIYIFVDT
jgi:hypothetical protein